MNDRNFKSARKAARRGFTLAEVMLAAGVGVLILGMTLGVMIALTRVYVKSDIKNSVSEDYRDMSRVMMEQGNLSNGFYLYRSFATADRNSAATQIKSGGSGDFVVFVYYGIGDITRSPNMQGVSRVLGFFRENPSLATSPIRYFDSNRQTWPGAPSPTAPVNPTAGNKTVLIESLLPPVSYLPSCPVLVQHTMGATDAGTTGGALSLFYNSSANISCPSLNVTGYIIRAQGTTGASVSGAGGYQSQTAFNFTVSPRIAN